MEFYTGSLIGKTLFAKKKLAAYNSTWKGSKAAYYVDPGKSAGTIKAVVPGFQDNRGTQYFMVTQPNNKVYFVIADNKVDFASLIRQGAITLEKKAKDDKDFAARQEGGFSYYADKWIPRLMLGAGAIIIGKQFVQSKFSK